MTPANIVGMAAILGAGCNCREDHKFLQNCPVVLAVAKEYGVLGAGWKINTSERFSVCLFPRLEAAMDFIRLVEEKLNGVSE